jgi:transcriptional regulator with XRE-family HTH domain
MADRDPYTVALAATLRAERARAGWTIEEMAERSGLNYETLRRMLRAERDISMDSLRRVSDALRVAPSYLLADAESRIGTGTSTRTPSTDVPRLPTDPRELLRALLDNPDMDDELTHRLESTLRHVGDKSARGKQLAQTVRQLRREELEQALAQLQPSTDRASNH